MKQLLIIIFCLLFLPLSALAQYEFDEEINEQSGEFELFGAIQLRADMVRDLPRPVEKDFERATSRGIIGIVWSPTEIIELGAAAKVNLSSQSNTESRFNLDNERADDLSMDELYLKLLVGDDTELLLGQSHFPLDLSPMLWDEDLRPQGISLRHEIEFGSFNRFELIGGIFLGNHEYGDESRISAIQAALRLGEGTAIAYDVIFSYLDFENLDELAQNGLARTNLRQANGNLLNDFDIVDLQLGVSFNHLAMPVRVRLDLVKNLEADDYDFGARADLIFGDSFEAGGIEFGVAAERIQREAVVAAFNDDDWWFPTWLRGYSLWFAYGFNDAVRLKLSGFTERRDDQPDYNKRVLLDLQWRY